MEGGVLLYRVTTDRWFFAEGEAAAAWSDGDTACAGADVLRVAGVLDGAPSSNGRGRVREVAAALALALVAGVVALTPTPALARSVSYSSS